MLLGIAFCWSLVLFCCATFCFCVGIVGSSQPCPHKKSATSLQRRGAQDIWLGSWFGLRVLSVDVFVYIEKKKQVTTRGAGAGVGVGMVRGRGISFLVSWLFGFLVSWFLRFVVCWFRGFPVSSFRRVLVSASLRFLVSAFLRFKVSKVWNSNSCFWKKWSHVAKFLFMLLEDTDSIITNCHFICLKNIDPILNMLKTLL